AVPGTAGDRAADRPDRAAHDLDRGVSAAGLRDDDPARAGRGGGVTGTAPFLSCPPRRPPPVLRPGALGLQLRGSCADGRLSLRLGRSLLAGRGSDLPDGDQRPAADTLGPRVGPAIGADFPEALAALVARGGGLTPRTTPLEPNDSPGFLLRH